VVCGAPLYTLQEPMLTFTLVTLRISQRTESLHVSRSWSSRNCTSEMVSHPSSPYTHFVKTSVAMELLSHPLIFKAKRRMDMRLCRLSSFRMLFICQAASAGPRTLTETSTTGWCVTSATRTRLSPSDAAAPAAILCALSRSPSGVLVRKWQVRPSWTLSIYTWRRRTPSSMIPMKDA
jgi:hypothetical protein